jgi:hypothetical protein
MSGDGMTPEAARPTEAQPADAPVGDAQGGPAAERGGCLKLGWGCLPVLAGLSLVLPAGLWL